MDSPIYVNNDFTYPNHKTLFQTEVLEGLQSIDKNLDLILKELKNGKKAHKARKEVRGDKSRNR